MTMAPDPGKSGRSGAGSTEDPGLSFSLCLSFVLPPRFGFILQFRPALALTQLLTALKHHYLIAPTSRPHTLL